MDFLENQMKKAHENRLKIDANLDKQARAVRAASVAEDPAVAANLAKVPLELLHYLPEAGDEGFDETPDPLEKLFAETRLSLLMGDKAAPATLPLLSLKSVLADEELKADGSDEDDDDALVKQQIESVGTGLLLLKTFITKKIESGGSYTLRDLAKAFQENPRGALREVVEDEPAIRSEWKTVAHSLLEKISEHCDSDERHRLEMALKCMDINLFMQLYDQVMSKVAA